jgi:hypothetical protein
MREARASGLLHAAWSQYSSRTARAGVFFSVKVMG